MAIDPRLSLGVQAPQIQSILDPMLKVKQMQAMDQRNMLLDRSLRQEDMAAQRKNRLSGIVASAYENNRLNPSLAARKLAEAGMGEEALQMSDMEREQQKEARLQQKDKIESYLNILDAQQKIVLGSSQETWEARDRPLMVELAKQANPNIDDIPEEMLPHQWNPDLVNSAFERSKTTQQRLTEQHQQTMAELQRDNQEFKQQVDVAKLGMQEKGLEAANQFREKQLQQQDARISAIAGKKGQGRPLSAATIDKITKTQGGKEEAARLLNTFKKDYAGYTVTGGLSNVAGKLTGDETGQAQWWQDYQTRKNQVRNDLFGSALTPTEQSEWEKSDINPRMDSNEVTKNLKRRKEIEDRGYKRQVENYKKGGFDVSGFEEPTADDWRNDPEYQEFLKEYNGGQ